MARILITGATAGIGRAAAVLLAHKGHTVIGAGRNAEALESLAAQSPNLHALPLDITDPAAVAGAPAAVATLTGGEPLDILVNNAGYACVGPLECIGDDALEAQYQVNVFGLLRVTRAFLPAMRERGSGRIVNVSSVAGHVTLPFFGPYASTKHALEALSDSLRIELRPHGIDVVLVKPGAVKTGFGAVEQAQLEEHAASAPAYRAQLETVMRFHRGLHAKGADPVAAAAAIVTACEADSPGARYVVPRRNRLFIAIKQWLPTAVSDWIMLRLSGLHRQ